MRAALLLLAALAGAFFPPCSSGVETPAGDAGPAASRRIIEGAIAMWRIHGALRGAGRTPDAFAFAADGRRFTLILVRGNLQTERNEFQLQLCTIEGDPAKRDSIELRREPLVTFKTPLSTAGISSVRWIDDDRIAFLGSNDGESAQVYELNVRTRGLRRRTNAGAPIVAFGLGTRDDTVLYASRTQIDPGTRDRARLVGLVPGPDEKGWFFGGAVEFGSDLEVFLQRGNGAAEKITTLRGSGFISAERAFSWGSGVMGVSPDGTRAVIAPFFGSAVPEPWKRYTSETLHAYLDNGAVPPSYAVVDLRTHLVRPLDIPAARIDQLQAAWSQDGKRLFVSGFLPPQPEYPAAADVDRTAGGVIAIEPDAGTRRLVRTGSWRIDHVSRDGTVLRLKSGTPESVGDEGATREVEVLEMRDEAGEWRTHERNATSLSAIHPWSQIGVARDFVVGHMESIDEPQEVVLVHRRDGWSKVVSHLNPQLDGLSRGRILPLETLVTKDYKWPVQIALPRGYREGNRYPTVIMIMDMTYSAGYVLDSHVYRAAYPIQALASRGIAVVMAYFPKEGIAAFANSREREMTRQFADAIVERVSERGLADPARIAMTGFSRAGWLVEYGIQHSKHRFAAAVAMDNFTGGYLEYVFGNAPPSLERFYDGALPYNGHGQAEWWKESVGFNAHLLQAPLLKEIHGDDQPGLRFGGWETYTGLRRFGIPVEYVYYQSAIHIMRRVPEQLSSAERQVDWLCYWLKDERDPSPLKAEQYARWDEMKKKWNATGSASLGNAKTNPAPESSAPADKKAPR